MGLKEGVALSKEDVRTERRRDHLAHHIGFAERWLSRAKQEIAQGDLGRSLLTLLLAEAEVHHARSGTAAREAALPRPSAAVTILGATALAAAILAGLAAALPRGDVAAALSSSPSVIRFKQPVGSTLALISLVVAPAPPTQAISAPPQVVAAARASRTPIRRLPARTAGPSRPAPASAPVPAAAPVLVSDGDLIDLVLAAERSLRGERR